jgi:hypothetical protein
MSFKKYLAKLRREKEREKRDEVKNENFKLFGIFFNIQEAPVYRRGFWAMKLMNI